MFGWRVLLVAAFSFRVAAFGCSCCLVVFGGFCAGWWGLVSHNGVGFACTVHGVGRCVAFSDGCVGLFPTVVRVALLFGSRHRGFMIELMWSADCLLLWLAGFCSWFGGVLGMRFWRNW